MNYYKSAADMIGGTPLLELKQKDVQARVFAKVEGMNPAGSIKDRAALYMIKDAEADGRLKKGSVIIGADKRQYGDRTCINCRQQEDIGLLL